MVALSAGSVAASYLARWGNEMDINPIEFGKVLGRLDAQDRQISELKTTGEATQKSVEHLVNLANQGKGGLMMLTTVATIVGSIIGWMVSHLFRG